MHVIIARTMEEKQTLGDAIVVDRGNVIFEFKTMELPWKDNKRRVSCIPVGFYIVRKHTSPKFGNTFHVLNVKGRSEILIHKGNYGARRKLVGTVKKSDL